MKTKFILVAAVASTALAIAEPHEPQANKEMQAVLDEVGTLGGKPIEALSPHETRKQPSPADAVKSLLNKRGESIAPEAVARVENKTIPIAGGELPIRIYSPCALANACKAVVVSTHYRLAPKHPSPASHEDVFAAYSPSSIKENL